MGVGEVRRGDDHDVTMAIRDLMLRAGIGGIQVARVELGGSDTGRVDALAKELADLVASRVLADFVDRHRVAAAVDLKRHLPVLADRHFLGRQMVDLICARVAGAADGTALKAWSRAQWTSREHSEIDGRVRHRAVIVREVSLLCPTDDGQHYNACPYDGNECVSSLHLMLLDDNNGITLG
jgi:hypothetical protein